MKSKPGIYLTPEMLDSQAIQEFGKWEFKVYVEFLRRRQFSKPIKTKNREPERVITNNGEIVFTYGEAEGLGIPRREFRGAIDRLIELGFLDISHQGSGGRQRDATTYFLADRWKRWGTPEFSPTPTPRVRNTKEGQGWSLYHATKKQKSVTILLPGKPVSRSKNVTPKIEKDTFRLAELLPQKIAKI